MIQPMQSDHSIYSISNRAIQYIGIFWCRDIFTTLAQMAIVLFWPV